MKQSINQKISFETGYLKEMINSEVKAVKSKLSRQLENNIEIEIVKVKDMMRRSMADILEKSGQITNESQTTKKSQYQYLFKPLLLKYKGVLQIESPHVPNQTY